MMSIFAMVSFFKNFDLKEKRNFAGFLSSY